MYDPQSAIESRAVTVCGMNLNYYLYEEQLDSEKRKAYSIGIRKESPEETEESLAYDITSLHRRAAELFRIISEGTVTPCTLTEILEDLL